jgi:hypothetical protein
MYNFGQNTLELQIEKYLFENFETKAEIEIMSE